jgi:hypothetical protein
MGKGCNFFGPFFEEDLEKYAGMPRKCKLLLEDGGNLMSHLGVYMI